MSDSEEEDEDLDIMKKARKNISREGLIMKKPKPVEEKSLPDEHKKELLKLDPLTSELFKVLPPPKQSQDQSISNAILG
eukprot:CAMPEP_0202964762 /NCGR_PEP_ID=MMETSP1396-20130829/8864_1 /ASSEMBLY_ACC=CAM_ASM_000872 /TAXON_ID= /ORGANISM="Pseudokeronopsis sp., Strain Brazil" /LENGTH=78 /DNA_ID=CAMNT_0049687129 /DNA_START=59 /DNA_END=295 /DNA_ORIENTATION=+